VRELKVIKHTVLTAILLATAGCAAPAASPVGSTAPPATATPTLTIAQSPIAPSPSPYAIKDGEPWIVYEWLQECHGDSCGLQGVYLVRPDGRDQHLLLTTPAGHPDWSPDGRRIAVDTEPPDGDDEIWILDVDGTNAHVVTCDGAPCGGVASPAWSPDGMHLAFNRALPREAGDVFDRLAIEVLDLATDATRVVAVSPAAGSEYVEYDGPRWSPDGTQIVFTVMRYPTPPTDENILSSSIAVVKADGSEADTPRILTDPAMFGSYPDWSPDGERIVFNTYPIGSFQDTTKATNLYTIRPDGTDLTQVTHFGENDTRASEPTWTPDGQQIIFVNVVRNTSNPWGERLIALIDADGSNLTLIRWKVGGDLPGDGGNYWYGTHARLRPTP
jgi:Tol biopolymer transport system component